MVGRKSDRVGTFSSQYGTKFDLNRSILIFAARTCARSLRSDQPTDAHEAHRRSVRCLRHFMTYPDLVYVPVAQAAPRSRVGRKTQHLGAAVALTSRGRFVSLDSASGVLKTGKFADYYYDRAEYARLGTPIGTLSCNYTLGRLLLVRKISWDVICRIIETLRTRRRHGSP